MKSNLRLMLLFIVTFAFSLSLFGLVGCFGKGGNDSQSKVNPPEKVSEVTAVTLSYNGDVINGTLTADLSLETIELSARVDGDEGADKTVNYSSEDEKIASVDKKGIISLNSTGEVAIIAQSGSVYAKFILVISKGENLKYNIVVNGGKADKTTAKEGEYVKLTPNVPTGKKFVEWSFPSEVTWSNGSSFRMPNKDVDIVAVYEDATYTLNVIGATVKSIGTESNPTSEYIGNSKGGKEIAYDIRKYEATNLDEVVVEALAVDGCAFVGFDKDVKNNRVGDIVKGEYAFTMDASDTTITAIYSEEDKNTLQSSSGKIAYNDTSRGFKFISKGKPTGGYTDNDLNGANGYRFAIPANTAGATGYPENIEVGALGFDTMDGSKLAFVTFKNHHASLSVTVEWYLSFRGCGTSTGQVTIGPGEVKKVACTVSIGIIEGEYPPWSGFCVRKSIGGDSSDTVLLDMTISTAVQYPNGDKSLGVTGVPEPVNVSFSKGKNIRECSDIYNGEIVSYYSGSISDGNYAYTSGYYGEITNLPAFDPQNPTTTIYIRAINCSFMLEERTSGFKIAVASDATFVEDVQELKFVMRTAGQIDLIKFEITRESEDDKVYISFTPFLTDEEKNANEWHGAIFQYFYNDVIGYEE